MTVAAPPPSPDPVDRPSSGSVSVLALGLTWLVFAAGVVAPAMARWGYPAPSETLRREMLVLPFWLAPEPGERAAYLVGLLFLPLTAFAFERWLARRASSWGESGAYRAKVAASLVLGWLWWLTGNGVDQAWLNVIGGVAMPALWLTGAAAWKERERPRWVGLWRRWGTPAVVAALLGAWLLGQSHGATFITGSPFVGAWWLALPLLGLGWWASRTQRVAFLATAATLTTVGLAGLRVLLPGEALLEGIHFQAVFNVVATVHAGGTLLVDTASQYGNYPHALSALFTAVGRPLEAWSFSVVLVGLSLFEKAAWWFFLRRAIAHRPTRWLTFFGAVSVTSAAWWFAQAQVGPLPLDPYFQLTPLRSLGPAVVLALVAWLGDRPTPARVALVALGASLVPVWWNADFGVVAWGSALVGAVVTGGQVEPKARWANTVKTVVTFVAAAGAAYASFALFAHGRSGVWPDWRSLWAASATFYGAGVSMTPMPPLHPWVLVVSVYVLALNPVLRAWVLGDRSWPGARLAHVTTLAVLGLGEFSYYQGRSNNGNLLAVAAPAVFLVGVFVGAASSSMRRVTVANLFLAALAVVGPAALPTLLTTVVGARWSQRPTESPRADDVAYYRSISLPGQRRLVVSHAEGLFHAAAGTGQLGRWSTTETILRSDAQALEAAMQRPDALPVVVEAPAPGDYDESPFVRQLRRSIERCLAKVGSSPSGRLAVYQAVPGRPRCTAFDENG